MPRLRLYETPDRYVRDLEAERDHWKSLVRDLLVDEQTRYLPHAVASASADAMLAASQKAFNDAHAIRWPEETEEESREFDRAFERSMEISGILTEDLLSCLLDLELEVPHRSEAELLIAEARRRLAFLKLTPKEIDAAEVAEYNAIEPDPLDTELIARMRENVFKRTGIRLGDNP